MVARVTLRGETGRAGLSASPRSPMSHALSKAPGQTVSAGWALTNARATPASVRYSIWRLNPITQELAEGPLINVPVGQTVNVFPAVTWLVPNEPGTAFLGLFIDEFLPDGSDALVASHNFTVTVN